MASKRKTHSPRSSLVFLFDVDNTLLDNDTVLRDLHKYLAAEVGPPRANRYWKIFDQLREEVGYADYLGALQQYRCKYPHDTHLLKVSHFLIDYPFAKRLFRDSMRVLKHAKRWGRVSILSDGDVVFQPHKIRRSGLLEAVSERVLLYVHKQQELRDVQKRCRGDHYVVVDDKLHVLRDIKKIWRNRVTTVFVRQGHYAFDKKILNSCPPADLTINSIGDLLKFRREDFLA